MTKCSWCEGTGKFKQPKDVKQYEEIFDKYDAPGTLTMGECREKAPKPNKGSDDGGGHIREIGYPEGTGDEREH